MPKIITAHTGMPHITSNDVGALLKAVIGDNDYLLSDAPKTFTATLLDNNTVQLSTAEVVLQGTHVSILATDKVTIDPGQNGMKRIDLIVCRYIKDDNGIESAEIAVVKGTPSASPSIPVVIQGDIRNGATIHEMPLFKVEIEDFSVVSLENVCQTVSSLYSDLQSILNLEERSKDQAKFITKNSTAINNINADLEQVYTKLNKIYSTNLLWSGSLYMSKNHSITIPIAKSTAFQPNGIILVFSECIEGTAKDQGFHSFVVPKYLVKENDLGHRFTMVSGLLSSFCSKYLYISMSEMGTSIKGHENNTKSGTSASGVKYNNASFVLRYVIGF